MMDGEDGDKERFGPMLRLAALAATLLALAAVIGPRLVSSGGDGPAEAAASLSAAAAAASHTGGPSIPPPPTTTSTPPTTSTTSTTLPPATTTTLARPVTTTTLPVVAPDDAGTDGGAVELTLVGLHSSRYGPPRSPNFAGGLIFWHFRVANTGPEYLWGIFVYLEAYGPIGCDTRRLDVGESADCWAETRALEGDDSAIAWVTAWTRTHMVSSRLSHRVGTIAE
jgi:hypothetical protein